MMVLSVNIYSVQHCPFLKACLILPKYEVYLSLQSSQKDMAQDVANYLQKGAMLFQLLKSLRFPLLRTFENNTPLSNPLGHVFIVPDIVEKACKLFNNNILAIL